MALPVSLDAAAADADPRPRLGESRTLVVGGRCFDGLRRGAGGLPGLHRADPIGRGRTGECGGSDCGRVGVGDVGETQEALTRLWDSPGVYPARGCPERLLYAMGPIRPISPIRVG